MTPTVIEKSKCYFCNNRHKTGKSISSPPHYIGVIEESHYHLHDTCCIGKNQYSLQDTRRNNTLSNRRVLCHQIISTGFEILKYMGQQWSPKCDIGQSFFSHVVVHISLSFEKVKSVPFACMKNTITFMFQMPMKNHINLQIGYNKITLLVHEIWLYFILVDKQ